MLSVLASVRKSLGLIGLLIVSMALAACMPTGGGGGFDASKPVPVALLVPSGSGEAGDELLARSLQNAAQLAINDLGGVKIDLRVYSTAGQPAQAQAQAEKAIAEGAVVILGPVYALEANAVGAVAAKAGVSVLAFSNNPEIAGGNVFILGPTFQNTANRLASYAARNGKPNIMIVHDKNAAGEAGRAAIEQGAARSGARIVAVGSYEFSQNGVVQAVPEIVATAKSNSADALFFTADTAGALPLVSQLISENGLGGGAVQYIGLTRWDIPAATLSLPGVQGAWFAMPDPALYQQFQARYAAAYGEPPHPISGLSYDGIAAIGALVRQGGGSLSPAAFAQGSGFAGVNGVFRLRNDGTNERGLAVAQIQNGQAVVVDPAPRSFGGAGF